MQAKPKYVVQEASLTRNSDRLIVTSPVFEEDGWIPLQYTCDGANINPSLDIEGIPGGTRSLAIIVQDPNALAHTWTHWLAWNIPVVRHIPEARKMEMEGVNDFHVHPYQGPCPPYGIHRYVFKVFALDTLLELSDRATVADLEKALAGHVLGFGELTGRYKRK